MKKLIVASCTVAGMLGLGSFISVAATGITVATSTSANAQTSCNRRGCGTGAEFQSAREIKSGVAPSAPSTPKQTSVRKKKSG
jgi:hypothetical protein